MSRKHSVIREFFAVLGDAIAASAAVRNGQHPADRNLRGLGIDPARFREIKLR